MLSSKEVPSSFTSDSFIMGGAINC